jgi:hypothetical protein
MCLPFGSMRINIPSFALHHRHMNTRIFAFFLFFAVTGSMQAQSFQKKQMDLNIGLSVGNGRFVDVHHDRAYPLLGISFDYGITDEFSVGGLVAWTNATYKYSSSSNCSGVWVNYTDVYRINYSILGIRAAYHFDKIVLMDAIDLYAGVFLGQNFATYSFSTNDPCKHSAYLEKAYDGGATWAVFAGMRYRFNNRYGVFSELGYGLSYLTLGFNIRF